MDSVFHEFRNLSGIIYPPFSKEPFESFFYTYLISHPNYNLLKEKYIPIFWTESYIRNPNNPKLEEKTRSLTGSNYFTIIQHDDGVNNTLPNDTRIYSMGALNGKFKKYSNYIPIPLTYHNPDLFIKYSSVEKSIFISFIGSLTHNVRRLTQTAFFKKPGVYFKISKWSSNINKSNQELFLDITSKSKFTLAPRGYGVTSFRLYEALNLGSIPVYISDKFWLPFKDKVDWEKLAILCPINQIPSLYSKLKSISDEQIQNMLSYYKSVSYLFTYKGISDYIIDNELSK